MMISSSSRFAYFILIIIVDYCFYWSNGQGDFRSEVGTRGGANDPGVHARLSEKGVNYIGRVSGDVLREAVRRFRLQKIPVSLPFGGSATFYNVKVTNFKSADSYTFKRISPNKANYRAQNMDITLAGDAEGQILNTFDEAYVTLTFKGMFLDAAVAVGRDGGNPRFTVTDCTVSIRSMRMEIDSMSHKAVQNALNNNGKLIQNKIIPTVEEQSCNAFERAVNHKFNNDIRQEPLKMPLAKFGSPVAQQFSNTALGKRLMDTLQKMTIDRSLTRDPEFNYNTGDFWIRGECSWQGQGGTPFGPGPLSENAFTRTAAEKMLYVTVSDFVINSLLYNAYKNGALDFNLNKQEMPDYAKFLRLSCNENNGELCIGAVLPEVARAYPNADMQIKLKTTKAPAVILTNGKANAYYDGIAALCAGDKELADMDVAAEMDMTPTLENNMVKGQVNVKKLTGKLRSSSIKEINQAKVDDWSRMASIMIESLVNDQLQKGVPVPQHRLVKMQNAQLCILDRRLRVETDQAADNVAIIEMIQKYANDNAGTFSADMTAKNVNTRNNNNNNRRKGKAKGRRNSNRRRARE